MIHLFIELVFLQVAVYGFDLQPGMFAVLLFSSFPIIGGLYGIKHRRTSKKGSWLNLIGIINLFIGGFFLWDFMGSFDVAIAISSFILVIFICSQILLFHGGYKNYRAYEKQLSDRLRGIF